jgi:hypothetical protein
VGEGRDVVDVVDGRKADTCAVACRHRAGHRMVGSSPLANRASSRPGAVLVAAWSCDDLCVLDADPDGAHLDGADPGNRESSRRVDRRREEDLE